MRSFKIGIITSRGGHLIQMLLLKDSWGKADRFWVTFRGEDTKFLEHRDRVYYASFPEVRNITNFVKNLYFAWSVLRREKPDVLISSGAGIAPPFFYIGKLLGIRLIFVELLGFVCFPSLSAKLVEPVADLLLVQSKKQKKFFRKAKFLGSTL